MISIIDDEQSDEELARWEIEQMKKGVSSNKVFFKFLKFSVLLLSSVLLLFYANIDSLILFSDFF